MKYYPARFCATDTNTTRYTTQFKDEERRLVHRRDKNRKTESALRVLQIGTPFKLLFNYRNRVNVDHPPFRCRHVVVSASRNRRRRKETERRSNSEVPPSNKSAPDESKHNTVSKVRDEPSRAIILCIIDSFSKERSSVEIIEKDTFRTEAEGVFFSSLNTLLSVDYLLLFGVDGVLPEIINGMMR